MRLRYHVLLALAFGICSAPAQTTDDLFNDSVMHEIRITMKAADWSGLKEHYLDNTYFNVDTFAWKGAQSASVSNVTIRSRGHGSRSPIKPGLHVDFNRNVANQTFLGLTSLDLKNNSQDPSLLHELISMSLFRRMGVVASREASTRVYVNNEYIGVFNLVESPDQVMLKRVFNENNGYLYEYRPGDYVPGGGYHFEYLGDNLDNYAPLPYDPQTHSLAPDTVTLEGMTRTVNQASDADFLTAVSAYLDPKLFLTHVAVETYVGDFDCILGDVFGMNNFFLYRFENKKLSQFIAWDKDNAFDWNERPIMQNTNQNVLTRRLLAIPAYRNFYLEALIKCSMLSGGAGGWMEQESNRLYNLIHDAAYQDNNKLYLDGGNLVPASNDKFESVAANLKAFAAHRTPFVLQQVLDQGYQFPSSNPAMATGGMVSAAPGASAAAGSLASIYGANFGSATNTSVYINGYLAPMLFASPGQVNVQVPWQTSGTVTYGAIVGSAPSNLATGVVSQQSPGVFATVHAADGSLVDASKPAVAGETLVIYGTGLGPVNGAMVTGQLASSASLAPTTQAVTLTIDGTPATVSFAGLTPGFLGLYQINAVVPRVPSPNGNSAMVITVGGQSSQAVSLPSR